MQLDWSVKHCLSSYGRQQCSVLSTHSSLCPPSTGQVAYSHQRDLHIFKFGEITLSNCFIFLTFCQEMQLCLRFCCCEVVAQPFLYREPGSAVVKWLHSLSSTGSQVFLCLPFSMARLCSLSLYFVKVFLRF